MYATWSVKGGVGKTTAAVTFAHLSARQGRRTLLWDLDPQGAASWLLRVRPRVKGGAKALVRGRSDLDDVLKHTDVDGLDLVPSDESYRELERRLDAEKKPTQRVARLLRPLRHDYDVVVLDCPPSVTLVSENVVDAADVLVVPLAPAPLAVRTLDQLLDVVAASPKPRPRVLAFLSQVDRRRALHRELAESLPRTRDDVSPVCIPAAAAVERMGVERRPLAAFAPRSPAARAYAELWDAATAIS